ncbi:MAG: triose-phosphate isomerase [Chloroflexi bacterium]|nr:triose-phosphate isomerase [Chloroflexota bacterium]
MRTPLIAGNWKAHTRADTARALCRALRELIDGVDGVEKVVCPPFVYLTTAKSVLDGSAIRLGAQDVHWQDDVAATGEVGPAMLAELVEYVIIGHSERRANFGDTDEVVNRKVKAALGAGLRPIMCVGETLREREADRTEEVLVRQLRGGLKEVDLPDGFVIAYEPVWAIGTGIAATGNQANEAIGLIRREVAAMCGPEKGESVRILYGGSVDPGNIAEFMAQPEVDCALVGGASLNADSFSARARRPWPSNWPAASTARSSGPTRGRCTAAWTSAPRSRRRRSGRRRRTT